jgi:tRNA A-37 threonylcarbamoyl transferase component Bud32
MHGLIFLQFQRFAQKQGSIKDWESLLREAQLTSKSYSPARAYPDEDILALVAAAGRLLNMPTGAVLDAFGEFVAPELIRLYARLINPAWKALDLIENTEKLIHTAVRVGNPGAEPPVLHCTRSTKDELQIVYSSGRQLCSFAKGIVKGVARHYGEIVHVTEDACMVRGYPFCALQITRMAAIEADTAPIAQQETHDYLKSTSLSGAPSRLPLPTEGRNLGMRQNGQERFPLAAIEADAAPLAQLETHDYLKSTSLSRAPSRLPLPPEGGKSGMRQNGPESFPFLKPPLQGDELGRLADFRILQLIGQGTMGIVFRAEDARLHRFVALKVMQPELASDTIARERFMREARAMAALKNDHVVTVYEVGIANNLPFLAMEFLEGETLDSYQKKIGRLPLSRVVRIGKESAQGLAAAHAYDLVHRDIKPSNLWLEAPTGRVKILDFGLARRTSDSCQVSQIGLIVGTPAFMSPEQARGQAIDYRADLFSLGCVLYWLCTGQLPFQGDDILSTLTALATQHPSPPHALSSDVPPALSDLIMELLHKDPSRRPASTQAVVDLLAAIGRASEVVSGQRGRKSAFAS